MDPMEKALWHYRMSKQTGSDPETEVNKALSLYSAVPEADPRYAEAQKNAMRMQNVINFGFGPKPEIPQTNVPQTNTAPKDPSMWAKIMGLFGGGQAIK